MAFLGGDTDKIKFILTNFGQEILATRGLVKEIAYYEMYDPEVNYKVNVPPSLLMDISGNKKTIVPDSINFKDKLQS